ncbi:hypothetical protein DUNSADRAFT_15854 [Dunaliella salina]|uniref:Uncharacterized protein n=1 Tax=Dunaliella salina TaxID=3046 RepID=A0ABQ7G4R5_DUNSA|nr:hypothetical protein DUNSADRAFT_15854 [Dunaliella salina]|eukprot:KAF5829603.1 hypothetical protein DUNSADRAFT_15854 [Dunaliella salina]
MKVKLQRSDTERRSTAKIEAAAELSRQKEELHKVEMEIKAEEDYLNQQARDATKRRAELELEMRTSTFLAKSAEKERTLRERLKERLKVYGRLREQEGCRQKGRVSARSHIGESVYKRLDLQKRLYEQKVYVEVTDCMLGNVEEELEALRKAKQREAQERFEYLELQEGNVRNSLDMLRRTGTSFSLPHDIARSLTEFGSAAYFPRASMALPVQAQEAAAKDGMEREQLRRRLDEKRARVDALCAERSAAAALRASRGGDGLEGHALTSRARPGANENQAKNGEGDGEGNTPARLASRREDELRRVLREEIDHEAERQAILSGTRDAAELDRLQNTFAQEREESKRRILALSAAVNSAQAQHMHSTGTAGSVHSIAGSHGHSNASGRERLRYQQRRWSQAFILLVVKPAMQAVTSTAHAQHVEHRVRAQQCSQSVTGTAMRAVASVYYSDRQMRPSGNQ